MDLIAQFGTFLISNSDFIRGFLIEYAGERALDGGLRALLKNKPQSIEVQLLDTLDCSLKSVCKKYYWEYDPNAIIETFNPELGFYNSGVLQDIIKSAVGSYTEVTDEITKYWCACIIEEISKPNRDMLFKAIQLQEKLSNSELIYNDLFTSTNLIEKKDRISAFTNTVFTHTNPYGFEIVKSINSTNKIVRISYKQNETIYEICLGIISIYVELSYSELKWIIDNSLVEGINLFIFFIFCPLSQKNENLVYEQTKDLEINVLIKNRDVLFQYNIALNYKYREIFATLKESILDSYFKRYHNGFDIQTASKEYFIDRDNERKLLSDKNISSFFIEGASESGKSALVRNILLGFSDKHKIFWHTIHEKQDAKVINNTFWDELTSFFVEAYGERALSNHFGGGMRGFYFTDRLRDILITVFKEHKPIFVIDNIHNCLPENESMYLAFKTIITEKLCRSYFIGWEGAIIGFITNHNFLKRIHLKGMNSVYLNLILEHYTGESNPSVAVKLSEGLLGLPGYAIRYDLSFDEKDLLNENAFSKRIIQSSSDEEKIVLVSLSVAKSPVSRYVFEALNYTKFLNALVQKRLVELEKSGYTVHDNYKPLFKSLYLDNKTLMKIKDFIELSAKYNTVLYIDIINFLIEHSDLEKAYEIFKERFFELMQKDCFISLIDIIQKLETYPNRNIDRINLKVKKIILFERMSEYQMCYEYLQIIDGMVSADDENYADLFYIKIRCLYFQDKFEEILNICMTEFEIIKSFASKLQIQVYFIVARIYWIRGDNLVNALKSLLVCFRMAEKIDNVPLMIKAIHRISMLECSLGLVKESFSSFQALYDSDDFVAGRRKTFLLYRKAKCLNLLGHYYEAKKICNETIEIKKSFNDVRGLVFVNKLLAKVYHNEGNYTKALAHTEIATVAAKQSGIVKEEIANDLAKAAILISMNKIVEAKQLLRFCLDNSLDMGLAYRISEVKKIASQSTDLVQISELSDRMYKICIEKNKTQASEFFIDYFNTEISENDKQLCDKLFNDKSPISNKLLLIANLI